MAKYDSLPFKEDSVQSFNNEEVQNRIIYPITQSNADIELRLYTKGLTLNEGRIEIIQIFNDSVIAKQIFYQYLAQASYKDRDEYLGKNNVNYDILRRVYNLKSILTKDSLISYLKESNVFTIEDMNVYLKNKDIYNVITKPSGGCFDCFGIVLCEMKINKKVRNIHMWGDNLSGYIEVNPNNTYFNTQKMVFQLFQKFYNNIIK